MVIPLPDVNTPLAVISLGGSLAPSAWYCSVRTTRHGSAGLIWYIGSGTFSPSAAQSWTTFETLRAGLRARAFDGSTTCPATRRLAHRKRLYQSSKALPNWAVPEIASNAPDRGSNRKSRPRTDTGLASGLSVGRTSPPLPAVTP